MIAVIEFKKTNDEFPFVAHYFIERDVNIDKPIVVQQSGYDTINVSLRRDHPYFNIVKFYSLYYKQEYKAMQLKLMEVSDDLDDLALKLLESV